MFALFSPYLCFLYAAPRLTLLIPLLAACLAVVVGLVVAAHRRHLHIPAYVGMAFAAFVLAMAAAHFSGSASISGTPAGIALSLIFFLLLAVVVGSVLALFFYRHPEA
jgi:lysylphosphatidylglycerol synthetase-like protein (DUF2156 family)